MTPSRSLSRASLRAAGVRLVPVVNATGGRSVAVASLALPSSRSPAGRTGRKVAPVPPITPKAEVTENGVWFVLPEPPSANRYWKVWQGRARRSHEADAYRELVRHVGARIHPYVEPVQVMVNWFRGRKSGDLDNRLKATLDSLKGIAYGDDKQVVRIVAARYEAPRQGRLEVLVSPQARF